MATPEHQTKAAGGLSAVDRSVSGPSYNGIGMSTMLDRLRETHGDVALASDGKGKWIVRAWTPGHDPVICADVIGETPFSALFLAYKPIHKNYADQDRELREQLANLLAANA